MATLGGNEEDIVRLHSEDDLKSYVDALSGHGPQHEAIIQVDGDDDLTSVRSKLEDVRVPRVVLVVPGQAKCLREGLQFRVLRRLQRELGLDMVVVSDDLNRRGFARENGFRKVFSSLRVYYRNKNVAPDRTESVPFTDPEEFSPALSVGRWGLIIGGILAAVLAALAFALIPVAQVTVYPETLTMVRDVEMLVEIGGPRLDVTSQRLAGRAVEERIQVEGTINIKDVVTPPPASGTPQAPRPSGSSGFSPGTNVTLDVRDALRDRMMSQATAQAMDQMKAQLRSNESLPEQSIRTEVTSEKYDHNIGDVAETLGGSVEIVSSGLAFNNDDFNSLVNALWAQDVPKDYRAVEAPKLSTPAVVSAEGQHMTLRVHATALLQRVMDSDAITAAVRWRSLPEAQQMVARSGVFARPPEVTLWPGWAGRAFRVQVKTIVEQPSSAKQPLP